MNIKDNPNMKENSEEEMHGCAEDDTTGCNDGLGLLLGSLLIVGCSD